MIKSYAGRVLYTVFIVLCILCMRVDFAHSAGKVGLKSPKSTISDIDPLFVWTSIEGAEWYVLNLYQKSSVGYDEITANIPPLEGSVLVWSGNVFIYPSGADCSSKSTCSIKFGYNLTNGSYKWKITPGSRSDYVALAKKASENEFTIDTSYAESVSKPVSISPIAPNDIFEDTTPTFTWNGISGASNYIVNVCLDPTKSCSDAANRVQQVFTSSVCDISNVCTATWDPVQNALEEGTYKWQVTAYTGEYIDSSFVYFKVGAESEPSISISDVTVTEGDVGSSNADFIVSLNTTSSKTVTVDFATSPNGGITPNGDYTTTKGTLTFNPGDVSKTISVPIMGDIIDEANEIFTVTLSNANNAIISDATGSGTINDDDPEPVVQFTTISQNVDEGKQASITLELSAASGLDVDVPFLLSGTAIVADYTALTASPVTIVAGTTTANVSVDVVTDADSDDGETLILTIGTSTYAIKGTTDTHTVIFNDVGRATAVVPKTGQTTTYATGDDGDLKKGVAWPSTRFTDNANGTITDELTGLIWLKNADCFGRPAWANALANANALADGPCGLVDGSTSGDWRLPNRDELFSLIDAEQFNPALPSGHPFSSVQSNNYWSSSTFSGNTDDIWYVNLNNGYTSTSSKSGSSFYMWPVRDGQSTSYPAPVPKSGQTTSYGTGDDGDMQKGVTWPGTRFTNNGNGTITDELTGLIWLKNADCFGRPAWANALANANALADGLCGLVDGSTSGDWRLPNFKELESLINVEQSSPALPFGHPFSVTQSSFCWSSTTYANDTDHAWLIGLNGIVGNSHKTNDNCVWPVRGGQYSDNGDGTVTDFENGLIGLKDANCFGLQTWSSAMSEADNLADGSCGLSDGSSAGDWRLASSAELPILTLSWSNSSIFSSVQTNSGYWSSTENGTNSALSMKVSDSNVYSNKKGNSEFVWPVRNIK